MWEGGILPLFRVYTFFYQTAGGDLFSTYPSRYIRINSPSWRLKIERLEQIKRTQNRYGISQL